MPVVAVIGGQWGDEGKGKIVDMLAEQAQVVVRFSGGDNAGHTIVNPHGEFRMHLIPSGIFYQHSISVIGNGVIINPKVFFEEVDLFNRHEIDTSRLYVSDRANLIMPYHILLDGLEEESRGGGAIGTTRKGIGPAFADKTARLGIRTGDLLNKEAFLNRLRPILEHKNAILTKIYGVNPLSLDEVYNDYCRYGERLAPYIRETTAILEKAIAEKKMVLLEGAQGTLLDPDFGTYPYTTSSSPLVGGGCIGAGISPPKINHILGVFKAYCTRVGAGPMPTELKDKTCELIRERAKEYGATTGRPRRCGWFDGVAARFSNRINGYTGLIITRLDILDILPKIKLCVAYELNGKKIDYFPASVGDLEKCVPVYEEFDGWQVPTSHIRKYEGLPPQAKKYLGKIEELTSCQISIVSVGSRREDTIIRTPIHD